MDSKTLEIIIAGGKGNRLRDITGELPKPLVPFGAENATIDFPLSNSFNSGSTQILVLTQYQADMIEQYLREKWQVIARDSGTTIKTSRSRHKGGYKHTADAVHQNKKYIERINPNLVTILYADHVYSGDYRPMYQTHIDQDADLTAGVMQVPIASATRFGVFDVNEFGKVIGIEEKPPSPKGIIGNPGYSLINLGIYVFSTDALLEALGRDANNQNSSHDFAKDVIPEMIRLNKKVIVHRFSEHPVDGQGKFYWVDIGVPDDYHRAHMDLVGPNPVYSIDNPRWPLHIVERHTETPLISPHAHILDSRVSPHSEIGEARITNSVIFPGVNVGNFAEITDAVLMQGTVVKDYTRIHRAITRGAHIGPNVYVGAFPSLNESQNITKTDRRVHIVTNNLHLPKR
jgi:glucose-1-phosphate adenylyltransferase